PRFGVGGEHGGDPVVRLPVPHDAYRGHGLLPLDKPALVVQGFGEGGCPRVWDGLTTFGWGDEWAPVVVASHVGHRSRLRSLARSYAASAASPNGSSRGVSMRSSSSSAMSCATACEMVTVSIHPPWRRIRKTMRWPSRSSCRPVGPSI